MSDDEKLESWLGRKAIAVIVLIIIGGTYRCVTAEQPEPLSIPDYDCSQSWDKRDARCVHSN